VSVVKRYPSNFKSMKSYMFIWQRSSSPEWFKANKFSSSRKWFKEKTFSLTSKSAHNTGPSRQSQLLSKLAMI